MLTRAIEIGWLPWSISRVSDVGMSYGALAALGALTAAIPGRWPAGMDRLVSGLGDCGHRRWFHRCRPTVCVAVGHVRAACFTQPALDQHSGGVLAGSGVGVLLGAAGHIAGGLGEWVGAGLLGALGARVCALDSSARHISCHPALAFAASAGIAGVPHNVCRAGPTESPMICTCVVTPLAGKSGRPSVSFRSARRAGGPDNLSSARRVAPRG